MVGSFLKLPQLEGLLRALRVSDDEFGEDSSTLGRGYCDSFEKTVVPTLARARLDSEIAQVIDLLTYSVKISSIQC